MRQRHFAGEKLFVDYAGRTGRSIAAAARSRARAVVRRCDGASGCACAEATRTQSLLGWLEGHERALSTTVLRRLFSWQDKSRVGVTRNDRYEPV